MGKHANRIQEIDSIIKNLEAERERLVAIEQLPDIQQRVNDYLNTTYSGKMLLNSHTLDEKGLWKIKGEDPNCDMGGHHHQPEIGIIEGTLQEALEYGVTHPNFYSWGGGGSFEKVSIIKPKKHE